MVRAVTNIHKHVLPHPQTTTCWQLAQYVPQQRQQQQQYATLFNRCLWKIVTNNFGAATIVASTKTTKTKTAMTTICPSSPQQAARNAKVERRRLPNEADSLQNR